MGWPNIIHLRLSLVVLLALGTEFCLLWLVADEGDLITHLIKKVKETPREVSWILRECPKKGRLLSSDLAIIVYTFYLVFWICFLDEGFLFPKYFPVFKQTVFFVVVICLRSLVLSGLHNRLWRYGSTNDLIRIFKATMAGAFVNLVGAPHLWEWGWEQLSASSVL